MPAPHREGAVAERDVGVNEGFACDDGDVAVKGDDLIRAGELDPGVSFAPGSKCPISASPTAPRPSKKPPPIASLAQRDFSVSTIFSPASRRTT